DTSHSKKKARAVIERTSLTRKSQYFSTLLTLDIFAKEIRVFHLRDFFLAQRRKITDRLYLQDRNLTIRQLNATNLAQVLLTAIQILLNLYIIDQLLMRNISIAQYSLYTQSVNQLNETFLSLMVAAAQLYENHLFLSYLFHFLAMEPRIETIPGQADRKNALPSVTPRIEFQHVTFRYPDTAWNAIDNLSFTLMPGQTMALVGKNGAGKTTCVKLLAGLYQPTQGHILFDGVDISTMSRPVLRAYLGVLFQDY